MKYVLDTSALLSGKPFEGDLFISPGVLKELRRQGMTPQLDNFIDAKVRTLTPGKGSLEKIRVKAEETGDTKRLSPVDVELLALAIELEATIITDDYSIENIAKALSIPYMTVMMPPIKEEVHWKYRCTGCLRYWSEWHKTCPVCGARFKTARPRK